MELKKVKLDDIELLDGNPNTEDYWKFQALVKSLEKHGQVEPLVVAKVDGKLTVINGNHRVVAMRQMGWKEVEVVDIGEISKEEAIELSVKLNNIHGKVMFEKIKEYVKKWIEKRGVEAVREEFGLKRIPKSIAKIIAEIEERLTENEKKKFREEIRRAKNISRLIDIIRNWISDKGWQLDAGYLLFDFGRAKHIYVRMKAGDYEKVKKILEVEGVEGIRRRLVG